MGRSYERNGDDRYPIAAGRHQKTRGPADRGGARGALDASGVTPGHRPGVSRANQIARTQLAGDRPLNPGGPLLRLK